MKLKNKNKRIMLLKYLLIFCFSLAAHRVMNLWAWNQLKPEAKTALSDNQYIFVNAGFLLQHPNHATNPKPCPPISCSSLYPHPDSCGPCGDSEQSVHVNINQSKAKATAHAANIPGGIPKIGQAWDPTKTAYSITAALHYVQDMACPVHVPAILDSNPGQQGQHTAYESMGKMPSTYTFSCSSASNCVSYNDVVNKISNAEARLNTITTGTGPIFELTQFYHYNNGRYTNWKSLYDNNKSNDIKEQILADIAYACCVMRRYWKAHPNMAVWFQ